MDLFSDDDLDPHNLDESNNLNEVVYNNFMASLQKFPSGVKEEIAIQHVFKIFPPDQIEIQSSHFRHLITVDADYLLDTMLNMKVWASSFTHIVQLVSSVVPDRMFQQMKDLDPKIKKILKISANFRLPTPLIPGRNFVFYRVVKEVKPNASWVIFDISEKYFLNNSDGSKGLNLWRRRSGVLVERAGNWSKVYWAEILQAPVVNLQENEVSDLMKICLSAKHWVLMLLWWFNRRQSIYTINLTRLDAQHLLLMQTARMKMLFLDIVSATPDDRKWDTTLKHSVRFIRSRTDAKVPGTNHYTAVTTFALKASPSVAQKFLKRHIVDIQWLPMPRESFREREQWPLSRESFREREPELIITSESGTGSNHITLLKREIHESSHNINTQYLLRECSNDDFCCFVIASPVFSEDFRISLVHAIGTDIILHPVGFAILTDSHNSDSSAITMAVRSPVEVSDINKVFVINGMIEEIRRQIGMLMAGDPHA